MKEGEKKGEREKEEEETSEKGLKRKDSNSLPRQGERDRQIYMKETKWKKWRKEGREGGREGGKEGRGKQRAVNDESFSFDPSFSPGKHFFLGKEEEEGREEKRCAMICLVNKQTEAPAKIKKRKIDSLDIYTHQRE